MFETETNREFAPEKENLTKAFQVPYSSGVNERPVLGRVHPWKWTWISNMMGFGQCISGFNYGYFGYLQQSIELEVVSQGDDFPAPRIFWGHPSTTLKLNGRDTPKWRPQIFWEAGEIL